MSGPSAVAGLGDERFVSLGTRRRSGAEVETPVWVARDGDGLVVTTGASSGKVKRLRHTPEVTLRPCDRRGRVADGAPTIAGRAEIHDDASTTASATRVLRDKYGVEYRLVMAVESVVSAVRRRRTERVILRITDRA